MIANDPYAELERRFARISAVSRAGAILNWDRSTMMPDGASEDRARAIDRAHAPEAALQLGVRIVGDHALTFVRPATVRRSFSQ